MVLRPVAQEEQHQVQPAVVAVADNTEHTRPHNSHNHRRPHKGRHRVDWRSIGHIERCNQLGWKLQVAREWHLMELWEFARHRRFHRGFGCCSHLAGGCLARNLPLLRSCAGEGSL